MRWEHPSSPPVLPHFLLAAAEEHGETFPKGIKYYKKMPFQPRC